MSTEKEHALDFPKVTVREGNVNIIVPKLEAYVRTPSEYAPSKAPVFYNPVMEFNRDMSVLALQAYQKSVNQQISVCEPLTGCGVRGIRYASEVKGVRKVVVGDISERAYKLAKQNVETNGLDRLVMVKHKEANSLLSLYGAPRKRFSVVDIDPFGSPVPYLDSAIRALRNGGLLALTATDMAPLCGVHSKACIRKYGGKPLRTEYCHELAVRLLAGSVATTATKRDIGIRVVFSHYADHYVRLYVVIAYGAKNADESLRNMGYVLHCFNCFHRETINGLFSPVGSLDCSKCDSKLSLAGPLWLGKILDGNFVEIMQKQAAKRDFKHKQRTAKTLSLLGGEVDAPVGYYVLDKMCGKLGLPVPRVQSVIDALRAKGFLALLTHFSSKGLKTNASASDVKTGLLK